MIVLNKRGFVIYFIIVLLFQIVYAQGPDTAWTRTYGGSNDERAYSIQQTLDNGYIVAGWTASFGAQGTDIYLVRTDSIGDTLWTRRYGGPGEEMGFCVINMPDQGFLICGFTSSSGSGNKDLYLLRTNNNGDTIWTRTCGGPLMDEGFSLFRDERGILAVGQTRSFGSGGSDVYVVKFNDNGDTLWTRIYGGPGDELANCICATPDSAFLIAGYTSSFGSGCRDWWLLKLNSQGDTIWTKTFGGIEDEFAFCIEPTNDNNFVVGGAGYWLLYNYEMVIIKINPQGDTIWRHCNGSLNDDYAHAVLENNTHNGFTVFGNFSYELYYFGLDQYGHSFWSNFIGGNGVESAQDAVATADHGYAMAGMTNSFGAGGFDFYLIKTAPDNSGVESTAGNMTWPMHDFFTDYANNCIIIKFYLSKIMPVRIVLYDILGRIHYVRTETHAPGQNEIKLPLKTYSSGVYFIAVTCDDQQVVRKTVVCK